MRGARKQITRAPTLALCALLACGGAQKPATGTDELATLRDGWIHAFNAKQLDAVAATYALDAVFLPITGGRVVSAAAIRNLFERIWNQLTPHIELTSHVVERSGELAYDSGEYVQNLVSGGTAVNIAGNYLFIYRRQPDGWRIVEQIWTEASGAPDDGRRAK
jgi:ketosteroid isomerase-like protein